MSLLKLDYKKIVASVMGTFSHSGDNCCHEVRWPFERTTGVSLGTGLLKPANNQLGEQM